MRQGIDQARSSHELRTSNSATWVIDYPPRGRIEGKRGPECFAFHGGAVAELKHSGDLRELRSQLLSMAEPWPN